MKAVLVVLTLLAMTTPVWAQTVGSIVNAARTADERRRQLEKLIITEQQERQMGEAISARLRTRFGVEQKADLHLYVASVGMLIAQRTERSALAWTFVVLDTDGVNAFAAPGGLIHVTRGLLAMLRNEAELAAVLAHEIAHVSRRHTINAIRKGRIVDLGTDETFGKQSMLDWVTDKAYSAVLENSFDRDDEIDADAQAVLLAPQIGYAPQALAEFLKRLDDRNQGQPRRNGLFASHPETKERIEKLRTRKADANAKALVQPRYAAETVSFSSRSPEAIDVVTEAVTPAPSGADGSAPAATQPPAQNAQAEKKGGLPIPVPNPFRRNRPQTPPPAAAPSSVTISTDGPRGVGADRYAKGGNNPNPVNFTMRTPEELEAFRSGVK